MLKNVDFKVVYASGEDEPADFFLQALMNSNQFNLGLGFFRSSGFRALALGFAYFISKGGKMRMIINDSLSVEDKEAIEKGLVRNANELIEKRFIKSLQAIYETLKSTEKHFFNCLSWLIAEKKLELIIITPTGEKTGIAHQKFGFFTDQKNNVIAFNGSANFSRSALEHNLETISCFKSWSNEKSANETIKYIKNLFETIWNGKSTVVRHVPISKVKPYFNKKFPVKKIEKLLSDEDQLIREIKKNKNKINIKPLEDKILELRLQGLKKVEPTLPMYLNLYEYQSQAYNNWAENGYQGFFEMATGTGKTITALNCAVKLYETEKISYVIIIVPTIDLANQWKDETANFGFPRIIMACGDNFNWYAECLSHINIAKDSEYSLVVITTYASFAIDKFQSIVSKMPKNTLLIADEAHNFGTKRLLAKHPQNIKRRIGLSATPARYFDQEGTNQLLEYFNSISSPTIQVTLEDAIEKGFLSRYYYYPFIVRLTEDEMIKYRDISTKLMQYFDSNSGSFSDNPMVSILLIQRKRIIHRARNKLDLLREILNKMVTKNKDLKYTLVYVPEGRPEEYDDEDERLINDYSRVISEEFNLKQHQFIGGGKNRKNILDQFAKGNISILTAMKCLDEGVDVRRTENAIFCSSTGNPRQFIQRRGRILRKHPEKNYAYIYDMIVVPELISSYFNKSLNMERSILRSELRRVQEFASLAENKFEALSSLERVAESYLLDIYSTN